MALADVMRLLRSSLDGWVKAMYRAWKAVLTASSLAHHELALAVELREALALLVREKAHFSAAPNAQLLLAA
eukprot:6182543-Pleurochrysis_carterae.AAC.4